MSPSMPTGNGTLEREALDALRRMRGRLEELESARREPIAVVAGCQKCPAFKVCPLKTVLGDQPSKPPSGGA